MSAMKVCALTGHRDLPENFDRNALHDALGALIDSGADTFLCGMATGFDLEALAMLVEYKQRKRIFLRACIPYEGQEARFGAAEKKKYRELLAWCDEKTVLFPSFRNGCYLARDRYMVDRCDVVLAYCTKETGGTAYTVNYAKQKGVEVIFL